MANFDAIEPGANTQPLSERVLSVVMEILIVAIRACLGTLLGLSTFVLFGAYGLVLFTDLSFGTAITIIALGLNGVLLSSIAIGSLSRDEEPQDEDHRI